MDNISSFFITFIVCQIYDAWFNIYGNLYSCFRKAICGNDCHSYIFDVSEIFSVILSSGIILQKEYHSRFSGVVVLNDDITSKGR